MTVHEGTETVVHATGELDLAGVSLLEEEMKKVNDSNPSGVVLDLSGVGFIDSVGIALLLRLDAESREDGNRLRVVGSSSRQVRRILELTGVDRRLDLKAEAA
jgi:anti-sigma B factor antagonist